MELLLDRLQGPAEAAFALLSADEKVRADRLRDPLLRHRFMLARAFLRRALGARLGRDPDGLEFHYSAGGKPLLDGIHFNLSHTADRLALVISTRHPVGVDIEVLRAVDARAIAGVHFAPAEAATLARSAEPLPAFFRLWTRKEAVLKAHGLGITHSLAVLPKAWVRDFVPGIGYAGALAWVGDETPLAIRRRHLDSSVLENAT